MKTHVYTDHPTLVDVYADITNTTLRSSSLIIAMFRPFHQVE
jgi:hypothetical protein